MNKEIRFGNIYGDFDGGSYAGIVYDKNGLAPALNSMNGGGRQPMIIEPFCVAQRGRDEDDNHIWKQQIEPNLNGTTNSITQVAKDNYIVEPLKEYRVRRLTENECWKLQGLQPDDCNRAKDVGVSKTQLYKQAGNGICANCVQLIFEHLYKALYDEDYKCTDENFNSGGGNINNVVTAGNSAERERERLLHQDISYCIVSNYWKGGTIEDFTEKRRRQLIIEEVEKDKDN